MDNGNKERRKSLIETPLEEVLRQGAQDLLKKAVIVEVEEFLNDYEDLKDSGGRQRVVRNGYHKSRKIIWSGGEIEVKVPRAKDRKKEIKYESSLIPPYLRRSESMDEFIPYLYLKGISTGDFTDVLTKLLGKQVNLSSSTVVRLKESWQKDYEDWNSRDLSQKKYIYWWVDGLHFNVRLENERSCILVIIGSTEDGKKELVAIQDGYRESKLSWKELCLNLKKRGLKEGPPLVTGDGALGFWAAMREEFPETREQRCWVHKTANVLDKMPKSVQPQAKKMIHEIYLAPTKEEALKAFDDFVKLYEAKYPKSVACLQDSKEETMAFYDFPAEHWRHIRSTNPIESTFATVRLRTKRTKGCGSRIATLMMVFKLVESAQKRWQKLFGYKLIPLVLEGKEFVDGVLKEAA